MEQLIDRRLFMQGGLVAMAGVIPAARAAQATGVPASSVPCGFDRNGLPIGLQIIGKRFQEGQVLALARAYEQATEWHKRRPSL